MSYEVPGMKIGTKLAAADLSTKQFYAVKINTSGTISLCSVAGEKAFGILQNKPTSGKVCEIALMTGVVQAILGGTVDEGDPLTVDENGKLVVGYGADRKIAIAIDAGVSGDIVQVLMQDGQAFCQHGPHTKTFHFKHAKFANGDMVTTYTPGYAGRVKKISVVVTDPVTTAAKLTTLNLEIGTTDLTGGAVALTSANQTPIGAVVAGTAITAGNTFSAIDTISLEASATTTFIEGECDVVIEFA